MHTPSRLGPYELLSLIGAGGMGEVYRARDTRLDRVVAIKVLRPQVAADPERRRRFEREARSASALNHPNICTLHDLGREEDIDFIVMEFLDGQTLAERLRNGPLPLDQILTFATQIADALAKAHREHIIHRDLKPANIMLTESGAKLLDFGVAKLKLDGSDPSLTTTTRTDDSTVEGLIVGTSSYMSPEQAQGLPVDHRSDIFSFGILLYEMATGVRPFNGETRTAVIASILKDVPRPVGEIDPTLPSELSRLVRRCLEKHPEKRYQSASDLRRDLADIGEGTSAGDRKRRHVIPGLLSRRRILAALTLLALFAAVWLMRWPGKPTPATGVGQKPTASLPVPSVQFQVTAAPGWETQPTLSPDGSLVAYTSNESGNSDVWVVGVHGGHAVNVSNNAANDEKPAWFPDGTAVLFASDRGGRWNIWRAPALGGGASVVMTDARDPAISPDARQLAFVRSDANGVPRVMVALLSDPASARFLTAATPQVPVSPQQDPTWSPDGTRICYSSYRSLWIAEARGGGIRRLTSDQEHDIEPTWSPDGQIIYFSSFRDGVYGIWRVSVSGGEPERLSGSPAPERHPSLSKDGRRLAFSTFATNADIVLKDLATGSERQFGTTRDEGFPALSPDGTILIYAALPGPQGRGQLWKQSLSRGSPAGDPEQLTDQPGTLSQPDFSPDSQWIAYQCALNGRSHVWVMRVNGGEPVKFTSDETDDSNPAWSPDGKWIAFASSRAGDQHIFIQPIHAGKSTGAARQLTHQAGNQERPGWSLDATRIAYVVEEPQGTSVWTIDSAGATAPERIITDAGVKYLRPNPRGRGLIASGTWEGSADLSLRLIDLRMHSTRPLQPGVHIGGGRLPTFSFTKDGRLVAYSRETFSGDIWVTELQAPKH